MVNNNQKNGVEIVAEMSANHLGDLDLAKKIILSAKECGADSIKIQTYNASSLTIDCESDIFKVQAGSLWSGRYLYELYKEASTPYEWQKELKEFAENIGLGFFSTPFSKSDVDFLEGLNIDRYKVASFEAIDYSFLSYVASKGKPIIISTGISSLEEIEAAIDVCMQEGNHDITILKCTSSYPALPSDMNILTIKDMISRFEDRGVKVGLSDHSMDNVAALTAVALGASMVEKHFTLDRALGGADSGFSLEPNEFKSLVSDIRRVEVALGEVDYSINEKNRVLARSLFAIKDIMEGEIFSEENIASIRPGIGLHPKYYPILLGKRARRSLKRGEPLDLESF